MSFLVINFSFEATMNWTLDNVQAQTQEGTGNGDDEKLKTILNHPPIQNA